jgi:hypothetical protein
MKKTIKKAQGGDKFTMSEATRKRDSLDYDARTRRQAAINRATRPGGSYDDIVRKLSEGARKSDSLKTVFDKAIERSSKKSVKKQKTGGKTMLKRADGSVSQRGLYDNIRAAKGSGKKPTAAMLKQEKKIKAQSKKK